ncbi:hypothetical protein GCK72_018108 [Caenorhabditis remanei]|uniref:Uncharacterized protein n=1 Tax=Caenorhabditis remanei TaxID=31234 RepID=A0A6A5GA72_CAERE|nr:hypothetical protein GCK72_018108 [Caenorhabditis remanei]KAF1751554.1 hypothetical protein GCK72_018108 [Caenorhabditis remanei]
MENVGGCGDVGPRRSSRKRIIKKDVDFHYECDFNTAMYQSTSSLSQPAPQTKRVRTARPSYRMPTVVVKEQAGIGEEVESNYEASNFQPNYQQNYQPNSQPNYQSNYRSNYQSNCQTRYTGEPDTLLVDPVNRQSLLDSLVRLEQPDIINMNTSDILDIHCENLKRRFETITCAYLKDWSVPRAIQLSAVPSRFVGINQINQLNHLPESDELVVKDVVEKMLNAVTPIDN